MYSIVERRMLGWSSWCQNWWNAAAWRRAWKPVIPWSGRDWWILWKHNQRKIFLTNWFITDASAAYGIIHAPLFYFKSSHWFDDSFAENANPKQIIVKSVNTFAVWQIHFTIPCFFEQWTQYAGQCAFSRNGERSHESGKCNILTFDQYIIGDISIGYRAVSKMILNFGSRYQKYQRRYSYAKSSWYENINSGCQNRGICPYFERQNLFATGEHTDTALSLFKKHTLLMQKKLQMSLLTLIVNPASIW